MSIFKYIVKQFSLLDSSLFSMVLLASVVSVLGLLGASYLILTTSGYHNDQRALELLCLSLSVIFFLFNVWCGVSITVRIGKPVAGLLLIFFASGFFSSILSYSPRHALYEWSSFALLLMLSWIISNEVIKNPERRIDQVLLVFGFGCAFYIFRVIVVYILVLNSGIQPNESEFIIGFDNYRFFNHVQTISLPLLGLLVLRSVQQGQDTGNSARHWWLLLSSWWMLLFVSSGRGTFIGVFAGIVMVIFWCHREALPWCRVMLLSAVAGLIAYAVFFLLIPVLIGLQPFGFLNEVVGRSIENPSSSRGALWKRAVEITMIHPLLGAGPLHFAHYGRDINSGAHPHNWPLQIASEWGIPALLCLSVAIFFAFKKILGSSRMIAVTDLKNQAMLTTWLATGVAILVDGLFSGLIVMPSSQLLIVIYIGCAWGWVSSFSKKYSPEKSIISIKSRIGLSVLSLVMLFFLGAGLWPEIINLSAHKNRESALHPEMNLAPRIWGFGYF